MLASMSEAKLDIGPFDAGSGRIELFSFENVDIKVFAGPMKKKTVNTITAINKIEFFVNWPSHFGLDRDFTVILNANQMSRNPAESRVHKIKNLVKTLPFFSETNFVSKTAYRLRNCY